MAFYVPSVIDGAKHPARLFRRDHQQKMGPGSGVALPNDLKVLPLNVPGAGFRVSAGGGTAQSRDSGSASLESYGVVNDAQLTVTDVPGTGSGSGRRDLVILEITDPEMQSVIYPEPTDPKGTGGWLDGNNFARIRIISGVGASVTSLDQITTGAFKNVTGITLAAITWPASTGTITSAMITDLRQLQRPRTDEVVYARPRLGAEDNSSMYLNGRFVNGGEFFPGGGGNPNQFYVDIPIWATRMIIDARWMTIYYAAGKNPYGRFWMEYGDEYRDHTWPDKQQYEFTTQHFGFNAPLTNDERTDQWSLMDEVPVPAKLRGKRVTFVFKAGLHASSVAGNAVWMKWDGGLGCRIKFAERALDADLL